MQLKEHPLVSSASDPWPSNRFVLLLCTSINYTHLADCWFHQLIPPHPPILLLLLLPKCKRVKWLQAVLSNQIRSLAVHFRHSFTVSTCSWLAEQPTKVLLYSLYLSAGVRIPTDIIIATRGLPVRCMTMMLGWDGERVASKLNLPWNCRSLSCPCPSRFVYFRQCGRCRFGPCRSVRLCVEDIILCTDHRKVIFILSASRLLSHL